MRHEVTIDLSRSRAEPTLDLTVHLRLPARQAPWQDGPPGGPHETCLRVSLDHWLEQLRDRMRAGLAGKGDEDSLVLLRLLQAAGIEYWPPEDEEDTARRDPPADHPDDPGAAREDQGIEP